MCIRCCNLPVSASPDIVDIEVDETEDCDGTDDAKIVGKPDNTTVVYHLWGSVDTSVTSCLSQKWVWYIAHSERVHGINKIGPDASLYEGSLTY